MRQTRYAIVGAFLIGGVLLFAAGLFLIGDRRMMFEEHFEVHAEFDRLGGLQNGAKVRVAGMDAGEVLEMRVPAGPAAKFRVKMRVREDLHPLVRNDSVATIQSDGLVGNMFIQIDAGSEKAPKLAAGGTVLSRNPFALQDLMQQASDTIRTVQETIDSLKGDVERTVMLIAETAEQANQLIADVSVDVKKIATAGTRVANDTSRIVEGIRAGRGTVGKLINDDELYVRAKGIAQKADETMQHVRDVAADAKRALVDIRAKDGPVQGIATDFRQTITAARETMSDLADNAEALKRNFLFRGYFNRRGYFDLDSVGVDEYRKGALEKNDRRVLRIWLSAAVTFGRRPDGTEEVTPDGKVRLDSAMAAFLDDTRTAPLVIEGYADAPTRDDQFLRSRARAVIVRDYLINRFHLEPARVGFMPLGREAPGSPAGGTWEGVALALFTQAPKR